MTVNLEKDPQYAKIALTLMGWQVRDVEIEAEGSADFHFGLIPLDPKRNEENVETRHVAAYVGDADEEIPVMIFTNGDSWVEWGERRGDYADGPMRHSNGRLYGAPGLHVVVRFPSNLPKIEAEYYPKEKRGPHNPTGLWKDARTVAGDRIQNFFALSIKGIELVFADLLADGYRLCDYAHISDAVDWGEPPAWATGANLTVGMYA